MDEFHDMLLHSLSDEDAPREAAEAKLTELLKDNPDALCTGFLSCMRQSPSPEVRQLSAVLFRRYAFFSAEERASFWPRLSPPCQDMAKAELLNTLTDVSQERIIRHKLCDTVADVATNILSACVKATKKGMPQHHFWPELLMTLWQCVSSDNPALKENALHVFAKLPTVFHTEQDKYIGEIRNMLESCLGQQISREIQVAATRAFTGFVLVLDKPQMPMFQEFIPVVLNIIGTCITENEATRAQNTLEHLLDIANFVPMFLKNQIPLLTQTMLQIASNTIIEEGCRKLALELLVTLAESVPKLIRRYPDFSSSVFPLCFQFMLEIVEDDTWVTHKDVEEDEDDDLYSAGESSLSRLCDALGGSVAVPYCFQIIPSFSSDPDWRKRHAALFAISALGEGGAKQIIPNLPGVVAAAINALQDPHPRVRFAALNCIGQMSADYSMFEQNSAGDSFQRQFHTQVVPALLHMMNDPVPRVQAYACAALVNFAAHAPKDILEPYLDALFVQLGQLLANPNVGVQEQALTAIATLADSAEEKFQKYYHAFMPHLKHLLSAATDKSYRILRGKTMECIGLIGTAVGKEVFKQDALEVMQMLQHAQSQTTEDDDPTISYMLVAWARMCQILGTDFLPFLDLVLPPLYNALEMDIDLIPLEDDQTEDDLPETTEGWQLVRVGRQLYGMKCSELEDKSTAADMVSVYARELKGHFGPHVEKTAKVMVPLLKYLYDDSTRIAAASCLSHLLTAAKECPQLGPQVALAMWAGFSLELLKAIGLTKEDESEVLAWMLTGLKECILVMWPEAFPIQLLNAIQAVLLEMFKAYEERCARHHRARTEDELHDPEAELKLKELEELESDLLREMTGVIYALFKQLREQFLPLFEPFLPYFTAMLQPHRTEVDRHWALNAFSDLLQFCGPHAAQYQQCFVGPLLEGITHEDADVRQAACYAIGQMGANGGQPFVPVLHEALPRVIQTANRPDGRQMDNLASTENAISAFAKIVVTPENGFPADEALPTLFQWLPITVDPEEAEYVYSLCCSLLQQNNAVIRQPEHLAKVLGSFVQVLGTSLIPKESELEQQMMMVLHTVQSQSSPEQFAQLVAMMTPEQQSRLAAAQGSQA